MKRPLGTTLLGRILMPDPRYFGIALTLDELHKILGLPEDVKIHDITRCPLVAGVSPPPHLGVLVSSTSGRYEGMKVIQRARYHCFDIQTREVSQVVIHPLKER
jgi:hypothetical protein